MRRILCVRYLDNVSTTKMGFQQSDFVNQNGMYLWWISVQSIYLRENSNWEYQSTYTHILLYISKTYSNIMLLFVSLIFDNKSAEKDTCLYTHIYNTLLRFSHFFFFCICKIDYISTIVYVCFVYTFKNSDIFSCRATTRRIT